MKAKLLKSNNEEATFSIEIDAKTIEDAIIKEYKTATAGEKITPETVLLNDRALLAQYSELDKISATALDKLLPNYYLDAVKELGLKPMTYPKILPREMKIGEPCIVEVRIALEPEMGAIQFEGLEVLYSPVVVTEDDVTEQIATLRLHRDAIDDDEKLLAKLPFDTMEALTTEIRSSLESMAKEKTEFRKKEAVMKQLVDANPRSLGNEVIEQQVMIEIDQYRKQMGSQAMDNYMKSSGRTIDDVKKEIRPRAEETVKKNLLLTAVASEISPEITEDDIDKAILKYQNSFMKLSPDAGSRRKQLEEIPGAMEQLEHAIRLEKAVNHVMSKAVIREGEALKIMDQIPEYMK